MDSVIVQTVARLMVPFIQLYGIYVIAHGHLSPGGGFSGGAILGASMVLCTLVFGMDYTNKKVSGNVSKKMESAMILVYIGVGLVGILGGHNFLANQSGGFYMGTPGSLISAGFIPIVTTAVGFKVALTILTLSHTIIEEE